MSDAPAETNKVIQRLEVLINKLRARQDRYKSNLQLICWVGAIPIALAAVIFYVYREDLTKVGTIIAALIAFVGTIFAYLYIYYRKELDITSNKIEAIDAAKEQYENFAPVVPIEKECFDKLEKVLL